MELFDVPLLVRSCLYVACILQLERIECCHALTFPTHSDLGYYTNLVVDEHPGAAAISHIAAIGLVTMALVELPRAAK